MPEKVVNSTIAKRKFTKEDYAIGSWLSSALDDDNVCEEFKASIKKWMDSFDYEESAD